MGDPAPSLKLVDSNFFLLRLSSNSVEVPHWDMVVGCVFNSKIHEFVVVLVTMSGGGLVSAIFCRCALSN